MNIELRSDYPLTDDACKAATGKTLAAWVGELDARPELRGKRRDAISGWLYDAMGRGKDVWWATTVWVEWERQRGEVQKDGRMEGYNICVTKNIAAPVGKVFAAWTGSAVGDWLGMVASADSSLKDDNGNVGRAVRVREDKDLRYQWKTAGVDDETAVDVAFKETAGKTIVTLTHNRIQTREESDGLRRAWGEAFVRLKALLEA